MTTQIKTVKNQRKVLFWTQNQTIMGTNVDYPETKNMSKNKKKMNIFMELELNNGKKKSDNLVIYQQKIMSLNRK
jgi:hypothetical protein